MKDYQKRCKHQEHDERLWNKTQTSKTWWLHHRRPQTAGGLMKCIEEHGQTHEIAARGIVNMSPWVPETVHVCFFRLQCAVTAHHRQGLAWCAHKLCRKCKRKRNKESNTSKNHCAQKHDKLILQPTATNMLAPKVFRVPALKVLSSAAWTFLNGFRQLWSTKQISVTRSLGIKTRCFQDICQQWLY